VCAEVGGLRYVILDQLRWYLWAVVTWAVNTVSSLHVRML
jgi:hypothetical protein